MFYNIKIAFRNLRRNGLYSWINVIGLAVSLTACLLIMLWVQDELSYERFYENADDIYAVVEHELYEEIENFYPRTSAPLMRAAIEEIPEVENACAVNLNWDLGFLEYNGEKFFADRYVCADTSFFRIFEAEFVEGALGQAFIRDDAVVITKSMAKSMFGDESALGKQIRGGNGGGNYDDYYVSGVVADPPKNTQIQYDVVFSIAQSRHKDNWKGLIFSGFLLLHPDADLKVVGEKLRDIMLKNAWNQGLSNSVYESFPPYVLLPLTKMRLYQWDGSEGAIKSVRLFAMIAFVLLIIACINYVNLVTARAEKRRREIGLRKIVGAHKKQLFIQLITEAILLFFIALLLASLLIYILMPFFNQLSFKELSFNIFAPSTALLFLSAFLLIIILAGIYPALTLISFKPMDALQGDSERRKRHFSFRKFLVILQFTCSVVFIISTIVLNRQFHYIQTKELGYSKEQIFTIDIGLNLNLRSSFDSFKNDLLREPSIKSVSASEYSVLNGVGLFQAPSPSLNLYAKDTESLVVTYNMRIDQELFSTLEMELIEGEGFDGSLLDDKRVFLNETAAKMFRREDLIGKNVEMWDIPATISGVVKDFHFQHLSEKIEPLVMALPFKEHEWDIQGAVVSDFRIVYVRPVAGKIPEALAAAEQVWGKYDADFPFNYAFMDDSFQQLYQTDLQRSKIFNIFAVIAIFISCLGLFGLVTYTAETRTKEIGIRKVLGASVWNITTSLTKEFLILIGIAFLIALPLAYFWMDKMLQDYAYRIDISWLYFALAAGITLLLTILTVSFQALKAATSNPVKAIASN